MLNVIIIDNEILDLSTIPPVYREQQVIKFDGFADGRSALTYLWSKRYDFDKLPDIIFLNLELPQLSGWDFLFASEIFFPFISKRIGIIATGNPEITRDLCRLYNHTYIIDVLARQDYEYYLYSLVA